MRSRRQQQKRRKDILGIIGITSILALGGGGYYFLAQIQILWMQIIAR